MRLGVDTGGTFTDFVLVGPDGLRLHKVLSTPAAPEQAILTGIRELGLMDAVASGALRIVHGSTVATNAALERKGVRTAYVANSGLTDVLTLARQNRADLYDLTPQRPEPPVPAELCFGIDARLAPDGSEVAALETEDIQQLIARLQAAEPEAVAINLLYAWLDDRHERALETALRAALPTQTFITRSSFVLPRTGEYERGIATWLNAWLGPRVQGYVQRLQQALDPCRLAIMQSSGGTMAAGLASERAVNLLVSGPAGGLAAARAIGEQAGTARLLTFDMGGTSTDVALIDGEPEITAEGRLGPWPVAVPMLDIHTVGAGGGSIAWLDSGGALQVGPESAGADPGPACYGRGGSQPTVTDAHVVLGQLPASAALGGSLQLDVAAAEQAVDGLAGALEVDRTTAARGILQVANENMAQALRVMSIERGKDPRDLSLCCFGGAGGLHLCDLADALGMQRALIPCQSGVLSAMGMLVARPERQLVRTLRTNLAALHAEELARARASLDEQARTELAEEGHQNDDLEAEAYLELRYAGQAFALTLEYSEDLPALARDFHAAHRQRYGHALETPIELMALRVRLRVGHPELEMPALTSGTGMPIASQQVAVAGLGDAVPCYPRDSLAAGQHFTGPALILEDTATSLIRPGWEATVDRVGNLLLTRH